MMNPGIIVSTLGYWRQHNEGTVNSISSWSLRIWGMLQPFLIIYGSYKA